MSVMLAESMRRISGLLQSGQYGAAHSQLELLVAANPDYVEGLRLFAGTKQVLGDPAQAESLLRRALEIDPLWAPTLTTLAELLLSAGRSAEAVPLLQRAVQGATPYPRAALLLVRHYLSCRRCMWRHTPPWVAKAKRWRTIVGSWRLLQITPC